MGPSTGMRRAAHGPTADRTRPAVRMPPARVLARMGLLIVAWALAWSVTPRTWLASPWARFAWWTAMKAVVWLWLGALLFRPQGLRAWIGSYRGRSAIVLLLALAWVTLDAMAVRVGLREPATPPSAREMMEAWNAWTNVFVIAPLLEELLFRGLFWSALERANVRPVQVWALSASAFAALHLPGWFAMQGASPSLLGQLGLVLLSGLFCGAGRWLTGSVWAAALLHLVNNLASTGVFHG